MKKNRLGESELEVTELCLGTMNWGQQNTEAEGHQQLDYAIHERGINFIDTAEMYPVPATPEKQGMTETFIGNWLQQRKKRNDLIIASKVNVSPNVRTRPTTQKYDWKNIHEAIDGSLQRLQTDYLDLYYIHWPERQSSYFGTRSVSEPTKHFTPIEETLQALADIVKQGKVRYVAVSNESAWGMMKYLEVAKEKGLPKIICNQDQYNLTNRLYEIGESEVSLYENVPLVPYAALNAGLLTGKYHEGKDTPNDRFNKYPQTRNARYASKLTDDVVGMYLAIAKKYQLDPAQMALAFVRTRPFVASTILGATSLEQLQRDIDSVDLALSHEVLADINDVYTHYPDITC